jgi:hypothetical protein
MQNLSIDLIRTHSLDPTLKFFQDLLTLEDDGSAFFRNVGSDFPVTQFRIAEEQKLHRCESLAAGESILFRISWSIGQEMTSAQSLLLCFGRMCLPSV